MYDTNQNFKKLICSSFAVILFSTFGANATVSLPAPDNAALLYYQAMLLRPDFGDTYTSIKSVLRGNDPNEMVREYLDLRGSRRAISLADAASKILDCSWGIMRSQGNDLLIEWRNFAYLLEVDARTLAFDGQYRSALERGLSIRRFARHFNDEGLLGYLISVPVDIRSLRCIHYILGLMPPDRDTLTWLQSQISNIQGPLPPYGKALEIELNDYLQGLSEDPNTIEWLRQKNSEKVEDESIKQEILDLTDKDVLELIKESNNKFLSIVNRLVSSDMPYRQKYFELKELQDELINPPIIDPYYHLWTSLPRNLTEQHGIYIRAIANYNVTRAAIEIYLIKAETEQLPEELPADLPKNPFSSQDFEYETTTKGFVLRCREEEISDKVWEYEFTIVQ
jgi:hypothetical protein